MLLSIHSLFDSGSEWTLQRKQMLSSSKEFHCVGLWPQIYVRTELNAAFQFLGKGKLSLLHN